MQNTSPVIYRLGGWMESVFWNNETNNSHLKGQGARNQMAPAAAIFALFVPHHLAAINFILSLRFSPEFNYNHAGAACQRTFFLFGAGAGAGACVCLCVPGHERVLECKFAMWRGARIPNYCYYYYYYCIHQLGLFILQAQMCTNLGSPLTA